MRLFSSILDFILLKFSFEINTELDQELIKNKLIGRFNRDQSFLYPVFENNKFAFSHKNLMPKLYNFSPVIFEGEITKKNRTSIFISVKIYPIFIWIFVFAISIVLISYFTNLGGMRDEFQNTPFPINPVFSPIFILIPYGYYAIKIFDVKGIIKNIVRREEKRAIINNIVHIVDCTEK